MSEIKTNPKVDGFIAREPKWADAYQKLRSIVIGCGLVEELKWGVGAYTLNGKNVVLMHGFKDYCALLLVKGALLPDPAGVLVQQTENVQSARQIRFTSAAQVAEMENLVTSYVQAAIEAEKAGLKVERKTTSEFKMAEEFQKALEGDAALTAAFGALTPGRQRGYMLHFASPKLAKTREARVETAIPRILEGKGLDD